MRILPATATQRTTGSEVRVMELLRGVRWGEPAAALHSLNLAEMEYKRWGEIDFVLVGRPGILVVEVKGGDVSCREGIWRYTDGYGRVVRRHESPLVQAKDAYFGLMKKYLEVRFGDVLDEIPTGFCAILAGAQRKVLQPLMGGPEFPADLWGCREDLSDQGSLQGFLGRALAHWRRQGKGRRGTMPDALVREVVSYLRPNFERVQSLSLALTSVRQEQVELTQDQYSCLDHWEGARRLLVTGPAGCGKTFIAVEMARRAIAEGARVLFVTGTDGLARDLARKSFPKHGTLIPQTGLHALDHGTPFDLLIIDEGQLVLAVETLERLGQMLDGGLTDGRWAWFGDHTHQGDGSVQGIERLEWLRSLASVTPRLQENCRNTPQVVAAVELCSGAPIGHARVKGAGPPVEYLEIPTVAALPSLAAAQLKKWLEAKVDLREMLLLLGGGRMHEFAAEVAQVAGVPVLPWERALQAPATALGWASVEDFRGLEAPFVLLTSLEGDLPDAALKRLLYAGMSRPNLGLTLAVTTSTMARLRDFNTATFACRTASR